MIAYFREHLEFMSKVRMDKSVPNHVRKQRVEDVIKVSSLAITVP